MKRRPISVKRQTEKDGFHLSPDASRKQLLEKERGTYHKKWTNRLPVGLFYPNSYRVGMSNLGFQLVYRLLNEYDHIVCERFFLPEASNTILSVESGRTAENFPVIFISVSFEHDYVNLARFFLMTQLEPLAARRRSTIEPGQPLVVCGGVATFMNPEPLAPFVDLFAVGEAEVLLPTLLESLSSEALADRNKLLFDLNRDHDGFYVPAFYQPHYDEQSRFSHVTTDEALPKRIKKVAMLTTDRSAHSELLTPAAEFADLYLTELGRGCSRGCRFCAAGFIYRPPRLWDSEAILKSLAERPDSVNRIGLLGMEMTARDSLERIAENIGGDGCSLSFSSLRADRISDNLLTLLSESKLKSVAIAPDGGSERLRRVINKQLSESDLLEAASKLTQAGLYRLKLYLMIGLPTETQEDLEEFVDLVEKMRTIMNPIGKKRGRLSEISISVNCFVPKPWTPYQFHPYGISDMLDSEQTVPVQIPVKNLRTKIAFLKKRVAAMSNVRIKFDNPEQALFQAVLARGDRRLAEVLLNMADSGISWKQVLKRLGLKAEYYVTRQYGESSGLVWNIIDHSIHNDYLWDEYRRSFQEKSSAPCDTSLCRRCGVCND